MRRAKTLETAARIGFAAHGVVYLIVSVLAVLAAMGAGGQVTGGTGALQTFLGEPFGWIWLWLIALGLLLFGAWQLWNGAADADSRGDSPKAIAARGAKLLSGLAYFGLAAYAINLAMGLRGHEHGRFDEGVDRMAAGTTIRSLAGCCRGRWHCPRQYWLLLGRAGFIAKGVVFNLIGAFLILAGVQADPSEAEGLGGALRSLQGQPYGWILLGLTAIGLGCYGAFSLAQAFYRRINVPDPRRRQYRV